jgi:hypothetical protein
MLIQKGALSTVPRYAVLAEDAVARVLPPLADQTVLQQELDASFRQLEAEQPALAAFLADELNEFELPAAQALAYFLFLLVFRAFREGFGARLPAVAEREVEQALQRLLADGEVRSRTCIANSYSEDMVALNQPALMRVIQAELEHAPDEAGELGPIMQALLVEILALTHAVLPD